MAKRYLRSNPRRPRPTRYKRSALARLRNIADRTQKDFAAMCGINYNTYRAAERRMNGEVSDEPWISQYHAELVSLVAGVDPDALMGNELKCLTGKTDYTEDHWEDYQRALTERGADLNDEFRDLLGRWLEHVCRQAESVEGPVRILWHASLGIVMDRFGRDHEAMLTRDGEETPEIIPAMVAAIKEELGKDLVNRAVKSENRRSSGR